MKISEERKSDLYLAVSDPIFELRVSIQKYGAPSRNNLDLQLFSMEQDIWQKVIKVLKIND